MRVARKVGGEAAPRHGKYRGIQGSGGLRRSCAQGDGRARHPAQRPELRRLVHLLQRHRPGSQSGDRSDHGEPAELHARDQRRALRPFLRRDRSVRPAARQRQPAQPHRRAGDEASRLGRRRCQPVRPQARRFLGCDRRRQRPGRRARPDCRSCQRDHARGRAQPLARAAPDPRLRRGERAQAEISSMCRRKR